MEELFESRRGFLRDVWFASGNGLKVHADNVSGAV